MSTAAVYAICCVQTIHRRRQSSSHTRAAPMAEFQIKNMASCLHILFANTALFLQEQLGELTGQKGAT